MKTFSLLEVNGLIAGHLAQLGRDFWLVAEVAQATFQQHAYLELVQQEKGKIVAKSRAAIWQSTLQILRRKLGTQPETILKKGSKVLLLVTINFHEVYGLSLIVNDLDQNFALGEMEAKRQATLERLQKENLLFKQKQLLLPVVFQKIAVISSAEAAGYGDFMHQLTQNQYGYQFNCKLFPAAVQGEKAASELKAQLEHIRSGFDAVVLIRGGGSKLDLAVFDEYEVASALCMSPLPILTGIGHQRDDSVCDSAAALSFKTPTAVAEYLINTALAFETKLLRLQESIIAQTQKAILSRKKELESLKIALRANTAFYFKVQSKMLSEFPEKIQKSSLRYLERAKMQTQELKLKIEANSPERILSKGYSLTMQNGKVLRHKPEKGSEVETKMYEFSFKSEVL
jgi:exodeoxyribonuclease VII large subunit